MPGLYLFQYGQRYMLQKVVKVLAFAHFHLLLNNKKAITVFKEEENHSYHMNLYQNLCMFSSKVIVM